MKKASIQFLFFCLLPENHRLESAYNNHLIVKLVLVSIESTILNLYHSYVQ